MKSLSPILAFLMISWVSNMMKPQNTASPIQMWAWVMSFTTVVSLYICLTYLEQELGSEEDVGKSKPHEGGESRHEGASEIQILAVRSHQRGAGEAAEDGGGDHEGGGHEAGVHHHGHLEQGAHAEAGQKSESEEHGQPLASVLAIIRGEVEAESEAHGHQGKEEAASLEDVCEEVDVGPGSGGGHSHGQAGVHILEMSPHRSIELGVERVQEVVNCCSHIYLLLWNSEICKFSL